MEGLASIGAEDSRRKDPEPLSGVRTKVPAI
jgi:hypothetical protein